MALTSSVSSSSGAITTCRLLGITDSNGIIHLPVVFDNNEAQRELSQGIVVTVEHVWDVRQMMMDGFIAHAPLVLRFIVVLLIE